MKYSELRAVGITAKQMKAITGHSNPAIWGAKDEVPAKYEAMLEPHYQAALETLRTDHNSDPIAHEQLQIAHSDGGYHNTAMTEWTPTYISLVNAFKSPRIGTKDGSYFVRASGTHRSTETLSKTAYVLILDGDSRIDEHGEVKAGAPDPAEVSRILTKLSVSHALYSSHSNGATEAEQTKDSGGRYGADYHKYRVVIPCTYSPEQLPALIDYLFAELHSEGVMLCPVNENLTWAQAWYFPRVPDKERLELFTFYQFEGESLDVESIYRPWQDAQRAIKDRLKQEREQSRLKAVQCVESGLNPIKAFRESYTIEHCFEQYGFKRIGKKWLSPNSGSGIPGVIIRGNKWFSKHSSDAAMGAPHEKGGRFGDAFDLFVSFEHGGDRDKALIAAGNMFTAASGKTINRQQQIEHMAAKNDTVVFAGATNTQDDEITSLVDLGNTSKTYQTANFQDDIDYSTMPDYGEPPTAPRATNGRYANADELADDAKAPDYLINDILESNSHGMMGGASQSLKTFMALKMAHSICTGNDFFGNQVFKTGKVIYICGEGRGALNRRIKALKIAENGFNDNLHVLKLSLCIDNLADMDAVKKDVEQHKPVLAIFDTFSSLTANANENDNSDVARVMRLVRESCNGSGASTLVIHHYGKDATRGLRGASAFFNNVDFVHEMTRAEGSMIATMACKKMKDGETFPDFDVQAAVIELGLIRQDGKVATSLVLKMPDADYCKHDTNEPFKFAKNEAEVYEACLFELSKLPEYCPETVRELFTDSPQKAPKKVFKKDNIADHAYKLMQTDKSNRSSRLERALLGLTKKCKLGFYNGFYWLID